jgi:hypothetical protein
MFPLEKEKLIEVLKAMDEKISALEAVVQSHAHSQPHAHESEHEQVQENSQPTVRKLIEGLERTLKGQ